MKKILYLLNYVGNGGTEKYVYDLISARGPEHCVLVYSEKGPGLTRFEEMNVKSVQISMNHPFDVKASLALKKVIQQEKIEVVHAQFLRENYIAVLAKLLGAQAKVIWSYHVDVAMGPHIKFLNRIVTKFNYKVIAVSNFMGDKLALKGVGYSKYQVIYNGVPDKGVIEKQQIINQPPIISVVGRLSAEKGHAFLIEALDLLDKKYPDFEWICKVFGDGTNRQELERLVETKGLVEKVQFFGHTNEIDQVYRDTDLIVIPSENEALSYVGIEAMSYGIPIVGTAVGGIPEVVENGATGYLVSFGDEETMAEKIYKVLTDEEIYRMMSKNGKANFMTKFQTSTMIDKTFELYDQ